MDNKEVRARLWAASLSGVLSSPVSGSMTLEDVGARAWFLAEAMFVKWIEVTEPPAEPVVECRTCKYWDRDDMHPGCEHCDDDKSHGNWEPKDE